MIVVVEPRCVTVRVTEFDDLGRIGKVRVHPLQARWIGESSNERIATVRIGNMQRCHDEFTRHQSVILCVVPDIEYLLGDVKPSFTDRAGRNFGLPDDVI
jgi:hypothetical protein